MTYLGLNPFVNVSSAVVVQLHDIENALSNLLAVTFWIGEGAFTLTANFLNICQLDI